MGKITGAGLNNFKSAEYLYSKIKREFKSFAAVNLLDDLDFPQYTADVLNMLGNIAYKESIELLHLENGKADLPCDFKQLYAAYNAKDKKENYLERKILQNSQVFENDITDEVIQTYYDGACLNCNKDEKVLQRITIRQYVNEGILNTEYDELELLTPSPNAQKYCINNKLKIHQSKAKEFTINNKQIFTNFKCDRIVLQYYAFPIDENGMPEIPDIIEIERAVEWYIKWQILLNFWLVDDVQNVVNKWQKAEELFNHYFGEAKYIGKLPSFSTLVNYLRNVRGINKLQAMSKHHRINF